MGVSWEAVCERLERNPEKIYQTLVQDLEKLGIKISESEFELIPLPGGASNRGYLRAKFNSRPNFPADSLVVMVLRDLNPTAGIEEVVDSSLELSELPFLNVHRYFSVHQISVPRVYHSNLGAGLIYLEDLGDILLRQELVRSSEERKKELLKSAIDELLKIHLEAGSGSASDFIGFKVRFDEKLLFWELEHFKEWALEKRGKKLREKDLARLEQCFQTIVQELLSAPYILSHRDYHIDNLLVWEGKIRVIDFQDALLAPYPYDLASLLYDRDTSQILREPLIEEMIHYYFEKARELGYEPLGYSDYRRVFDLCLLHRSFKVVGRFYFLAQAKNKPEYLNFLPAVYQVLSQTLDRFGEFKQTKEMLASYLPQLG